MATAATSQLNVRMDSQLRSAGDAVLERIGVTPAEIVRALWAKIAGGAQECEQVLELLAQKTDPATPSRGDTYIEAIDGWHTELFALAGVTRASYTAPSDEELDEMLYDEWLNHDGDGVVS